MKQKNISYWLSVILITVFFGCIGSTSKKVNLFELPGPLFSYGQFIPAKGLLYTSAITYFSIGPHIESKSLWFPRFTYGLRDDLSLTVNVPIQIKEKYCNYESYGLGDMRITLEYQLLKKKIGDSDNKFRLTTLASLYLPTGSATKNPPTGFGAPSYFWGTTASFLSQQWYFYGCQFMQFTTKNNCTKFGNIFYYTAGIGKNCYCIKDVLITFILECADLLTQKDLIDGIVEADSGGNTLFLGPSALMGNEDWFVQGGILFPVVQQLNGVQAKLSYFWGVYAGIKV